MSTTTEQELDELTTLQQVFDRMAALDNEKAIVSTKITEVIEFACSTWKMNKAALKAAFKWYNMTEGERNDYERTFQECKAAVAKCTERDLFREDFDEALAGAVLEIRHGRKPHANPPPPAGMVQ